MYDGDRDLAHKTWQVNLENKVPGFYQFDEEIVQFMNEACEHLFRGYEQGESL
ncbi:hypothetical protein GCM10011409_30410 [Lentibacillus populi]|uniref:Uncharacterized protein n=1 Tax=Lentibacillus populi TaxID=1827502 RepID=A0A9W5X6W1_9BACI|nr:hypothetical protein GCM10011409_30410 [Lentibacillus populi]